MVPYRQACLTATTSAGKLSYNSKWGYEGIKRFIWFSNSLKEAKSVVVVRLQQLVRKGDTSSNSMPSKGLTTYFIIH